MKEGLTVAVSSTGRFAAEQGDRFLRAVSTRIARTIKSPGIDEVHDLRVAIRRCRRILAVLKPCFPRVESRQIRRGLKQIMALAGAVRDHDIALRLFTRVVLSESPSDGSGGMVRQLQERREHAARALSTSLRRWVRGDLSASWRKALKSGTAHKGADAGFCATPADTTARTILPAKAKEHFIAGEAAMGDSASIDELHKFRIAAKNLRYTLDAFAPLYGESLVGLVDRLKEVQDLLGDIHDCAVVRNMLAREKEGNKAGRKQILSGLKKRQRKKMEEFRKDYAAEFSSAATLRQWQESLRQVGAPKRGPKKSQSRRSRH